MIIFIFVLGAAIGSFLNVLIDRLVKGRSIMGRSHCDYCKHTLSAFDLVPILSFAVLQGKCRYCKKRLSYQYPLVEFTTAVLYVLFWSFFYSGPDWFLTGDFPVKESADLIIHLALLSVFIVIFFTDVKNRIIPDEMQIAFFILALLIKVVQGITITGLGFSLFEGVVVMLPILFLHLVTRGKGMGFGDVKLGFNIGFLLGLKGGLFSLYFGFIIGAVAGIFLLVTGQKKLKSKIAFGPFLLLGVLIVFVFKTELFSIFREIYGF